MKTGKIYTGCLAVLLSLIFVLPPGAVRAEVVDRIVAVVNGETITLFELNQRVKPYIERFRGQEIGPDQKKKILEKKKEILDNMVEEILLKQQAEEYGIEVKDMEVENRIQQIKDKNDLSEEELRRELKKQDMTLEDYSRRVKEDILKHRLIGAMVKRKVVVTDEEIEEYYQKNKADFSGEKKVDLNLILLSDSDKSEEVFTAIKEGEISFEQAAAKHSIGPQPEEGGSLGSVEWASLNEDFKDALQGLEEDEVTPPFEFKGNAALLKIKEIEAEDANPLSEVKEEISEEIYREKFASQLDDYLDQLKDKAVIDIRL